MTIPRTSRYPRQPITKAQTMRDCWYCGGGRYYRLRPDSLGDVVRDFSCIQCGSTGKEPTAHAWTTNLTPTSPPLPPERRSKLGNGPDGIQIAQNPQNALQLTGYIRHVTLSRDLLAVGDGSGFARYLPGAKSLEFDFTTTGDVHLPDDWTPTSRKVNITITEAE